MSSHWSLWHHFVRLFSSLPHDRQKQELLRRSIFSLISAILFLAGTSAQATGNVAPTYTITAYYDMSPTLTYAAPLPALNAYLNDFYSDEAGAPCGTVNGYSVVQPPTLYPVPGPGNNAAGTAMYHITTTGTIIGSEGLCWNGTPPYTVPSNPDNVLIYVIGTYSCPSGYTVGVVSGAWVCMPSTSITLNVAMQGNRLTDNDQFTVAISGLSTPSSATTQGTGNQVTSGTGVNSQAVDAGTSYTIQETAAGNGPSPSVNYLTIVSCSNSNTESGTTLPSGPGLSFAITPAQNDDISCTFTNTAITTANSLGNPANADGSNPDNTVACACGDGGTDPGGSNGGAVSDPVNAAIGNKFETVTDYVASGASPLRLTRFYNSLASAPSGSFGNQWRSFFDRAVKVSGSSATVYRPDGKSFVFTNNNGLWQASANVSGVLTQTSSGWSYVTPANVTETYNSTGQLTTLTSLQGVSQALTYDSTNTLSSVTDSWGRHLVFTNDGHGHITGMTDANGGVWVYAYDSRGDLASVTGPDSKTLTYLYETQPGLLTGVIDENGNRTGTTTYDARQRALSTIDAGPLGVVTFAYNSNFTVVTDANGNARTYRFTPVDGIQELSAKTQPNGTSARATYDTNGNLSSRTDYNGNVTTFTYDLTRNLETSRTEAIGSAQARTITQAWNSSFRLPTEINEPGRTTSLTYDAHGNALTRAVTDTNSNTTRTWAYTYNNFGQVLTITDPVGQVSLFSYDASGNVQTITDALKHVTHYGEYNGSGQVGSITDPNGSVTLFSYDPRGRMTGTYRSVGTVAPSSTTSGTTVSTGNGGVTVTAPVAGQWANTLFTYDAAGQLIKTLYPDGNFVTDNYDGEHRLIGLTDNLGNNISYTLDANGNTVKTEAADPSGATRRLTTAGYDALSRLAQQNGANGQQLLYGFDANSNMTSSTDALGRVVTNSYDALNREIKTTNPEGGATAYGLDALNHLISVNDPRGLSTSYQVDAFGDVTQKVSPDSGTTKSKYDLRGLLTSQTDADGNTASFTYDKLGRVTEINYGGSVTPTTFTYDTAPLGIGYVATMNDASGETSYAYDLQGHVARKTVSFTGDNHLSFVTGYAYTPGGQLADETTPAGHIISYTYTAGRVSGINIDGKLLLNQVKYDVDGSVLGFTWANGQTDLWSKDLDGRPTQLAGALNLSYAYDSVNRVTSLNDRGTTHQYAYTPLDFLAGDSFTEVIGKQAQQHAHAWTYDADGNRLTEAYDDGQKSISYAIATASNQLSRITDGQHSTAINYDANGSTTSDGQVSYQYDARERLVAVTHNANVQNCWFWALCWNASQPVGLHDTYNGLGQRVAKASTAAGIWNFGSEPLNPSQRFFYDEAGHLISEWQDAGLVRQEHVWLGNRPVAVIDSGIGWGTPGAVYQVHTDALNTPRLITTAPGNNKGLGFNSNQSQVVWQWTDRNAFGTNSADSSFLLQYNLRFPGQYYDQETGLNYNYYRDYNPKTGRYVESDPIGLAGGLNTYAYAAADPARYSDALGLDFEFYDHSTWAAGNGHITLYFQSPEGQWFAYNERPIDDNVSNLAMAANMSVPAMATIAPVDAPLPGGVTFLTTTDQDLAITLSAISSAANYNNGTLQYNLYSGTCKDAAVNVINGAAWGGPIIPNPATTLRPNTWIKQIQATFGSVWDATGDSPNSGASDDADDSSGD